ncbi:MAG TPA: RHS repeat-associated core domain-containing protein [Chitinophagales bacterium]|nr:RHS repeat-associated core domain-containing protein [Chitinophagales bacterium]
MNQNHHDPFGMLLVGRNYSITNENYRFGFNGYENTDELLSDNIAIDFGARMYDSRLGRFLSIDPRSGEYPWQTPYAYFSNSPIAIVDIDGMGGPNKDGYTDPNGNNFDLDSRYLTQTDDKSLIINTCPSGNWTYAEWVQVDEGFGYYDVGGISEDNITINYSSKWNSSYQQGSLWVSDLGYEAIFPNDHNPPAGWSYSGSGIYSTSGRTNMSHILANSSTPSLWMPNTRQSLMVKDAFRDGAKDAAIFWVAGITLPFVIAYTPSAFVSVQNGFYNTLAWSIFRWQAISGTISGGSATYVMIGERMERVRLAALNYQAATINMPSVLTSNVKGMETYNSLWFQYMLRNGSQVLSGGRASYGNVSSFYLLELQLYYRYATEINTFLQLPYK